MKSSPLSSSDPPFVASNGVLVVELGKSRMEYCPTALVVEEALVTAYHEATTPENALWEIGRAVFEALSGSCRPIPDEIRYDQLKNVRFLNMEILLDPPSRS